MLALTIDNFPPALHAKLQEVALRNHVSIAQQVQLLLEPKNCNPCSKGIKIVIWSGSPPLN
jgi:hypothetical protein